MKNKKKLLYFSDALDTGACFHHPANTVKNSPAAAVNKQFSHAQCDLLPRQKLGSE